MSGRVSGQAYMLDYSLKSCLRHRVAFAVFRALGAFERSVASLVSHSFLAVSGFVS